MRVACLSMLVVLVCGCEKRVSIETLNAVASDIFSGKIATDANGVCPLDSSMNVVGDTAYVTTLKSGSQLVLFCTWQGKGSNLRGYLFTNGPPLVVGSEIEVVAFRPVRPNGPHVANVWIKVDAAVGKAAYAVSRSLD